eukprot:CAMPEP_0119217428 /NCGR_PEP_ID=MMETSP1327-20130426/17991_1 /TAXON_ID=38833 /ORGANISM="Micromonas pusilla, Strain RCC2306" /LENGTH=57 /DNA_ID=CAMNT_0007215391 /DNA_START=100 /DNA_END=270 /DNA_ORIENTATION=+
MSSPGKHFGLFASASSTSRAVALSSGSETFPAHNRSVVGASTVDQGTAASSSARTTT